MTGLQGLGGLLDTNWQERQLEEGLRDGVFDRVLAAYRSAYSILSAIQRPDSTRVALMACLEEVARLRARVEALEAAKDSDLTARE